MLNPAMRGEPFGGVHRYFYALDATVATWQISGSVPENGELTKILRPFCRTIVKELCVCRIPFPKKTTMPIYLYLYLCPYLYVYIHIYIYISISISISIWPSFLGHFRPGTSAASALPPDPSAAPALAARSGGPGRPRRGAANSARPRDPRGPRGPGDAGDAGFYDVGWMSFNGFQ